MFAGPFDGHGEISVAKDADSARRDEMLPLQ
jgi:hypothetical protein